MHQQSQGSASHSEIRAVLFDLDGTLVDSAPDIAAACNRLLRLHDLAPLSLTEVRGMIGNGITRLVERAHAARNVALDESLLAQRSSEMSRLYSENLTDKTTLMPGADDLIRQLVACQIPLALVTNKPEALSRAILAHFGWTNLIPIVVGGDSLPTRKPDPQMLLHACTAMSVPVDASLMVGDSPADIDAANAAGMQSVAMRGGYTRVPVDELGATRVCDDFSSLRRWLTERLPV